MAYDIWLSLKTRERLEQLKQDDQKTYEEIRDHLVQLSIERENFKTGVPERVEIFMINNLIIYYRILHRLNSIDVVDIREIVS